MRSASGNFLGGVVGPIMLYLGFFTFAAALVVGGLDAYYFARAVPVEATVQDRETLCTLRYTARDEDGDDRIYESEKVTCEQAEIHALRNPQHEYRFVRHHRTLFMFVMPDGASIASGPAVARLRSPGSRSATASSS